MGKVTPQSYDDKKMIKKQNQYLSDSRNETKVSNSVIFFLNFFEL